MMSGSARSGVLLAALWVVSLVSAAVAQTVPPAARTSAWSADAVAQFEVLPVQVGGRIMPLSTHAKWTLVRINGHSRAATTGDERLAPTEWMLDCLFYPEQARHYPVFLVRDSDVLQAIGLSEIAGRKSDRYSFEQLIAGREALQKIFDRHGRAERKTLDRITGQTLDLYHNVVEVYSLLHGLEFARRSYKVAESKGLRGMFDDASSVRFSEVYRHAPALGRVYGLFLRGQELPAEFDRERIDAERAALEQLLGNFEGYAANGLSLAVLPPLPSAEPETAWRTVGEAAVGAMRAEPHPDAYLAVFRAFEQLIDGLGESERTANAARMLHSAVAGMATPRGEYAKIEQEVSYYRADLFFWSLCVFVLSFLLVGASLLGPLRSIMWRGAAAATAGALTLLVAGIVWRCVLRGRPPIVNLYDTILFVTAVGVLLALATEWINRKRVGLILATVIGVVGLFFAGRHELGEAQDTMGRVLAVLDTNFWLATHVTAITTGYGAGILAGVIGHVYVLGRVFRFRREDRAFYRNLARMVYGTLCFSLLFSVVGTILGGIWANYSWGRFWGWDPKENGALMICLWQIAILHGRMGGFLRDLGVCVASVIGTAVIVFSWWHVNRLGVGLHSYGFTDGVQWIYGFYGVEAVVAVLGGVLGSSPPSAGAGAPPSNPAVGGAGG